eukprot:FR743157.1.p1 GENE.FR743157.1~~FR743157.1.p1  ORF type:complete len:271 (+),score=47.65 FR743157.1:65-814(+)
MTFIHDLITKEINRGTKPDRIFVAGHSLGALMVSRAVPTFPDAALGGAILLNGAWINQAAAADAAPDHKSLKVLAINCDDDGEVGFDMAKASDKVLEDGALDEFTFREQNSEDQNAKLLNHHYPSPADNEAIMAFIGLGRLSPHAVFRMSRSEGFVSWLTAPCNIVNFLPFWFCLLQTLFFLPNNFSQNKKKKKKKKAAAMYDLPGPEAREPLALERPPRGGTSRFVPFSEGYCALGAIMGISVSWGEL